MDNNAIKTVRVLKRLRAAVGYHELGMTRHALRSLDSLSTLGQIGAFGLVVEVLREEFAKTQEVSAAKALEVVSCMLPPTARRAVRMTLAACYGPSAVGRGDQRAAARGALSASQPKPVL